MIIFIVRIHLLFISVLRSLGCGFIDPFIEWGGLVFISTTNAFLTQTVCYVFIINDLIFGSIAQPLYHRNPIDVISLIDWSLFRTLTSPSLLVLSILLFHLDILIYFWVSLLWQALAVIFLLSFSFAIPIFLNFDFP